MQIIKPEEGTVMEIIEYSEAFKKDFIELNIAWIRKYFVTEQADYDILEHVDELLKKGSMIYCSF